MSKKNLRCAHSICSQLRDWRIADIGNITNMTLVNKNIKDNLKSVLNVQYCSTCSCFGNSTGYSCFEDSGWNWGMSVPDSGWKWGPSDPDFETRNYLFGRDVYAGKCHVFEMCATIKSYPSSTSAKNSFRPPHSWPSLETVASVPNLPSTTRQPSCYTTWLGLGWRKNCRCLYS